MIATLAALGGACLLLGAPAPVPPPDAREVREVRDVAQVFVIPALPGGPAELFGALRAAGADLVAVRAFHLPGDRTHEGGPGAAKAGSYFATDHIELVEDRLAADAAAARAAGLECWAWMTTRATPLRRLGAGHREVAWDFRTGRFEERAALDLFDPKVVAALEGAWADLARTGVTGAVFQDDLMMAHLEGFSRHARAEWRRRTGRDLDPSRLVTVTGQGALARVSYQPEFWQFAAMKRDRLLDVAARLQAAARAVRPDFEVALNMYYETALNPQMGLAWFAQDLDAAAARDFRFLAVMAYHRQVAQELSLDDQALHDGLAKMARKLEATDGSAGRILVKLQGIDWRTREAVPAAELRDVARHFQAFPLCLAPADDPAAAAAALGALRPAAVTPP